MGRIKPFKVRPLLEIQRGAPKKQVRTRTSSEMGDGPVFSFMVFFVFQVFLGFLQDVLWFPRVLHGFL